jgi:CheY-like chemotaxis protein
MRVLVVDDSPVIRQLIEMNLQLEGFEVTVAEDGAAAVELARDLVPDLITLDVVMPRMNGLDAIIRLRADPVTARIPVVVVSARVQPGDRARAERLGADAYVTKPFEPAELVQVVSRLAETGRSGGVAPG